MKSYLEILNKSRKEDSNNAAERHLRDIATLLAVLCDEINELNAKIDALNENVIDLAD